MGQFKSQAEAEAAGVYVSKVKSYVKREGRLT
ncbi:MAG: tRNA (guanosine(46)-N7)-methyltransferase TrmB, partial [Aestuariibacter sp.]|nr:tRNA (guanosine(46)-N7)-methyltransferase TrmB [Aestuariibacter sp.]MCP4862385.1 tRNA (guanosine(46)-N7)-methyltransferase TrmB [Alteromonas sp.]MCP4946011.1 tRNA (guanosine(46)-N7)-methyltransferase TrmB [Aestuariibacter sp.]MCP5012388.1 tRNA (guanosine(46)-N7)-methyltransferase TrmB [Aestuariibacter sp.]